MQRKYANIIIDISHEKLDRPFQYRIPEPLRPLLIEGMEVTIPFGNGNKQRKGYVLEITDQLDYDESRLKDIIAINDKAISMEAKILTLAVWMKQQYGSTLITAMRTVLPVKKKIKENQYKTIVLIASREQLGQLILKCNPYRNAARLRLLQELMKLQELPYTLVTGKLNVSPAVIRSLEKQEAIEIKTTREYRNPTVQNVSIQQPLILSEEQQQAVMGIRQVLQQEYPGVALLHGITGSGKTEVYIELIMGVIREGKQAIVLIPEIALTFQTLMRFYERFGDRVSVLHSKLSDGERFDQYERARNGLLDIMIGPRSALFTPFNNLGLIIIDEEHEGTYKSEKMPKYHAREVAEYIAHKEHAGMVLGSATPSLESYYKAKNGQYHLYELHKRYADAVLPTTYIIDMREELKSGNKSFFSGKLKELLTERLLHGEQTMLFINRRGYAGFVSCRECGYVVKCPHCDVSMSQHRNGQLICHYCGYEQPMVTSCPDCGSKYIAGFRAGTERIEQELKKEYPSIQILRMDADTTKNRDDYERILSAFANGEADVLIGTQMIVKGHDFPNVTLVGAIAADLSLNASDYHAAERTFQLLTQAAGRAGRGQKRGEVVIQTYQPKHYSIVHAASQDYQSFYEEEIGYRMLADYPPVFHMLAVQIFSKTEQEGNEVAKRIVTGLKLKMQQANARIIGPAPAVISKIKDIYRTVFYIKHAENTTLIHAKDWIEQNILPKNGEKTISYEVQFDFDPVNMF